MDDNTINNHQEGKKGKKSQDIEIDKVNTINAKPLENTAKLSAFERNSFDDKDNSEGIDSIMLDNISENYQFHKKDNLLHSSDFFPQQINAIKQESSTKETINEQAEVFKAGRLFLVLSIFTLSFSIFLFAVYAKIISKPPIMDPYNKKSRDYPWSVKTNTDIALRGQISSFDDYILTSSHKFYKIGVYVPSIYEEKRELLISLMNLYGNFNKNSVRFALSRGGNVAITDNASALVAANLRVLNQKLAALGVYKKCTFSYINKTSLKDSELQTMIVHAQIVREKGRETAFDSRILRTLENLKNATITESEAMRNLNIALVEYKNKDIDLSKECYTPIFTYNADVRDGAITRIERGFDIAVSQIEREYPFNEMMQPLLGFTNYAKKNVDGKVFDDKMKFIAQSGVEKYRDGILSAKRDGKISGVADRSGNIIFNKRSQISTREDGFNIKLTIPLSLQVKIQRILEESHKQYKAQQIVSGIMDPQNGEILALASSVSFNPNRGKRSKNIPTAMRVAAAERSFEPGSTIKPLVFSYLLNRKKINFQEKIDLHDGIYQLRTFTIRDSVPLKSATPEQILIKSSNIGMTKLTKNLSGTEMRTLFETFGIGEATGIDIANEATGLLPKASILGREVEKGAASYGYGLRMSFIQLLRSYAVFNNGGFLVVPHVTKHFISPDSKIFYPTLEKPRRIISKESADFMQGLLHRVVVEGTAKRADVPGLIIGGKTGTAREKEKGAIIYNGSFFGYASDGAKTYTIGVVIYGSQASEDYYAGQTTAPIFAKIAQLLVQEGYLKKNK
ncbi:cell division protein [Helicobacter sp. MIT 14-3879]|nr:cell division protein [Helicobacter sp. MIT 14-3879]